MMSVLVATDAWHPQVNGVVRSIEALVREAPGLGARIDVLSPLNFRRTMAMPGYSEIRLAIAPIFRHAAVDAKVRALDPDYIHIATEGPIGNAVRTYCLRNARPFTTSYHTKFPEYVSARLPVPEALTYAWLRRFHNAGAGVMVATDTLERDLTKRGFQNIMRWGRGVDSHVFRPRETSALDMPRPIFLYVGRVAVEKSIPDFLALDLPGSKVVVGDGPDLERYRQQFPAAHFLGKKEGDELAAIFAAADCFVFPSRTDTFGIVLIEALACGTPVAAYPVTGPKDIIIDGETGILSEDLKAACLAALKLDRARCREFAMDHSWTAATRQFLENVRDANVVRRRKRGLPFRFRRKKKTA